MAGLPSDLRLPRHPRVRTRDLDEAHAALGGLYGEIALDLASDPRAFEWRANAAALGPITIVSGACNGEVRLHGTPAAYVLVASRWGNVRVAAPRGAANVVPGRSAALLQAAAPMTLRNDGDWLTSVARIDRGFLEGQEGWRPLVACPGAAAGPRCSTSTRQVC
ncbi:hypothetical protein WME99_07655 [Sorangium sp. So ce136]|uniref:AraC-like ligand-binding domain-containing protein n=1 Tax=Sorangium sp. So ce136 TaxID=3133284 RepID=UPI003F095860